MTYAVELRDVEVQRRGTKILQHMSLGLYAGEFLAILGPSGSGKSSVLRIASGIWQPNHGGVLHRGEKVDTRSLDWSRHVGLVPQDDIVPLDLSVRRALRYAAELRLPPERPATDVDARVDEVMTAVDLAGRAGLKIRKLSGGQRKRVSVAIELLATPAVLLLDEPTSGLDPDLERRTMGLLASLARQGRVVATTTHSVASLDLATLVAVVMEGHLVYLGPPDALAPHFQVQEPEAIFRRLRDRDATSWWRTWLASDVGQRVLRRPAPGAAA